MKHTRKVLVSAFVIALALVWMLTRPSPGPSAFPMSVAFLGYTNTAQGTKFALFAVTNQDIHAIQRVSPGVEVEGMSGIHAPVFNPQLPWLTRGPLKSGAGELIAVGVPIDPGRWRLVLQFQRRTFAESLRDYCIAHRRAVPVTVGGFTLLGPPQYSSTNSVWLDN